ncbi:MAG TPA: HyaD/HybD family hydrogenase maturation endopeptidase [Vicinamibacterales bacterium]|jgi:hydrogenase maturation protease|nr:HyaD/HybD family hydrogenase maturation endopeptidase [Vicinamibacterales bacterium]
MTYVLGLGNVLMGDDGFGPTVVRAFEAEYAVGPGVEIVDLGTRGLDLTPWLADARQVIIIDTVNTGQAPGTLRVYDKRELMRHVPSARAGPHDPGVKEALLALDFSGRGPSEFALIGVVPLCVEMGVDLTPTIRAMVPAAVELLATMLRLFGAIVMRREQPSPRHPWWTVSPPPRTSN